MWTQFRTTSLLCLVLAPLLVWAQSLAASPELQALARAYPKCSLDCMIEYLPTSACVTEAGLNQTCVCTDAILKKQISVCSSQTCTVTELLSTMNTTSTSCGAPVRDHSAEIVISSLVTGFVALIIVIIRVMARLFTGQKQLMMDDWFILATFAVAIPPTVFGPILAANGLGKDMWTLPPQNITNVLEFFFVGEICYLVGLALNKISILCFFLRIFPKRQLRIAIYITMGLSAAYGIAFFFATLFQCSPISYMWWQWDGEHEGHCNNFHLQGWLAGGINMLLDLIVMVLPLGELAKMNMSKRKKASVMIMFLTGTFVTIISAVRLKYLVQFRHTQNPTYDYLAPGWWSVVEVHVGIICASMPAVYGLIQMFLPKLVSGTKMGITKGSSGGHHSKGVSGSNNHFTPRVTKTKGSRSDEFVMLTDMEVDALTIRSKASQAPLKNEYDRYGEKV